MQGLKYYKYNIFRGEVTNNLRRQVAEWRKINEKKGLKNETSPFSNSFLEKVRELN